MSATDIENDTPSSTVEMFLVAIVEFSWKDAIFICNKTNKEKA